MDPDKERLCDICGWELAPDPEVMSEDERRRYERKLEIARRNWKKLQTLTTGKAGAAPAQEEKRRKILFCADLYASSDYAFAAALDLWERLDAELIILHVLESKHRYSGQIITEDGEAWASEQVVDKLKRSLREYYFSRIEEENPEHVRIEVRVGSPWVEILRFARRERVDQIVMGPYSIREPGKDIRFEHAHLGENAHKVVLRARCPVSVVTSPTQRIE
jgi:nucleotide-binding universal stress UspA family protein